MGWSRQGAPLCQVSTYVTTNQKYSRLRCLLRVKGLVICFYLGWSGSILQFRQNIIKVGSKSWLLTCSSNITLSLPSYTGSALKRELNFCNGYLSLLNFWCYSSPETDGRMYTYNRPILQKPFKNFCESWPCNHISTSYFH